MELLIGAVWEIVEHLQELNKRKTLAGPIAGVLYPTKILTCAQRHIEPLSSCMCEVISGNEQREEIREQEAGHVEEQRPLEEVIFEREPVVPLELETAPPCKLMNPGWSGGLTEQPEVPWINGKQLTVESRVKDLADACAFLGINQSGSKRKLYNRLCTF